MEHCMDVVDFSNILYADDTFLVGKRSQELNKILWAIEKHSARYGMKLNRGKCVCINMGVRNVIKFKNGEKMKQENEATYLGGVISKQALSRTEVESRVKKALETCRKLNIFFKKAKCDKTWKLQVYNAVIISKLTYGLETLYLNDSLLKRLDAFHMRGLRHVMGIQHSYWSREKNEDIIAKVNRVINKTPNITANWREIMRPGLERKEKRVMLVSETLRLRRRKLLGHVIRTEEQDPLHQVTFSSEGFKGYDFRRVGRPRGHWAETTITETLKETEDLDYERDNIDHLLMVFVNAIERRI
jgi:hypothetical protein